jgi:peptidoglycan L-alanyl-D-glutamate endopeptidase CwlK
MSSPLELGSSGASVQALQQALAAKGFNPGGTDGNFGPATQAALIAFQRSDNLVPDGVAGPATTAALGLAEVPEVPSAVPGVTVQIVSQMFPVTPVANITANLPPVLQALVTADLADKDMVLMALGTIRAETESFEPISEGQSQFNTSPGGQPFDLYDNRKDLGNQGPPDGANFRGRGFVQLTGRANYARYAQEIGQDLLNNPGLANQPGIASALLARFLADRESAIRTALAENNLGAARRLVNGGSNGLDRFTSAFTIGAQLLA